MTVETLFPAAKERLVSISNTAPLTEAAARLGSGHVDLIAVCDKSGIIAGVISKTDIVSRISQCRGDACAIMASSVMSKNIVYCRRSDSLRSVWNLIKQNGVLHLPVVDDDLRPVGMIYARDVLQTLLQEAKHEEDLLRDYVNGVGYHQSIETQHQNNHANYHFMTKQKLTMDIKIRRAYDCVTSSDGYRVLVDRIWPRGLSKKELRIDCWMKDLAPSTPLRKWYGHDPKKWKQFKKRYFGELADHPDLIDELIALGQKSVITLVFAAKDQEHSNAAALRDYLIQNPA